MFNTLYFRKILLFFSDIFLLYLALLLALIFGFWPNFNLEIFLGHFLPFTILYSFWLIFFYIFDFYDLNLTRIPFLFYTKALTGLGLSLVFGMIFFYLFPFFGVSPKTNLLLNILIFGVLSFLWRKIFYYLFSSYLLNRVAIIGENPQVEELVKEIKSLPCLGYKLVAFLKPEENLILRIEKEKIDTLIIAFNPEENSQLNQNLYQCLFLRINFLDLAQVYEIILEKIPITFVGKIWFLENLKERKKMFYEKIKRIIDFGLALILLLITLPFWLLVALFIKLEDKGPIFYSQERIGKNKKPFFLLKFRSMKLGAEKNGQARWAEKEDPRITKVGKILRRTHLDEIPQMINILKGELSLVGPRPERPEFISRLEKQIPYYHIRHLIKPGFTGWAQIKFRYARSIMDSFEKFQYDLYYIKNRSFFLDIRILFKTFQLFFRKE